MPEATQQREWVKEALERFEGRLLRYAARLTGGDVETAQDAVQDTFLKLWQADPGRVDDHLAAWLYTVCRNRCFEIRRKWQRQQPMDELQLAAQVSPAPSPAMVVESREVSGAIWRYVDALPENQRDVVRLKFQEGLSYRQISEITSLSVSNVGYLLHTAVRKLRDELNTEGEFVPLSGVSHETES